MIFAVIGEELGLIGVDARDRGVRASSRSPGFRIALRCRDPFGKLLAAGHHGARLRPGGRSTSRPCSASRR